MMAILRSEEIYTYRNNISVPTRIPSIQYIIRYWLLVEHMKSWDKESKISFSDAISCISASH